MQSLFAYEARRTDADDILQYVLQEFGPKIPDQDFAHQLFHGILKELPKISEIITKFAPEWPLEKIDPVERVILYIGIFELLHSPDVPKAVVINEAIEIAKEFSDENSSKFINGVLNSVANHYRK